MKSRRVWRTRKCRMKPSVEGATVQSRDKMNKVMTDSLAKKGPFRRERLVKALNCPRWRELTLHPASQQYGLQDNGPYPVRVQFLKVIAIAQSNVPFFEEISISCKDGPFPRKERFPEKQFNFLKNKPFSR